MMENPWKKKFMKNFDVMNDIVGEQRRIDRDMNKMRKQYSHVFSKMKVYKYNAFPDMGGETSFVIGLLDDNNNGTLLNGMNSQNGAYVYAKENCKWRIQNCFIKRRNHNIRRLYQSVKYNHYWRKLC